MYYVIWWSKSTVAFISFSFSTNSSKDETLHFCKEKTSTNKKKNHTLHIFFPTIFVGIPVFPPKGQWWTRMKIEPGAGIASPNLRIRCRGVVMPVLWKPVFYKGLWRLGKSSLAAAEKRGCPAAWRWEGWRGLAGTGILEPRPSSWTTSEVNKPRVTSFKKDLR